jgi:hypothetical protein
MEIHQVVAKKFFGFKRSGAKLEPRPQASLLEDFHKGGGPQSGLPTLWEAAEGRLLFGGWLSA